MAVKAETAMTITIATSSIGNQFLNNPISKPLKTPAIGNGLCLPSLGTHPTNVISEMDSIGEINLREGEIILKP